MAKPFRSRTRQSIRMERTSAEADVRPDAPTTGLTRVFAPTFNPSVSPLNKGGLKGGSADPCVCPCGRVDPDRFNRGSPLQSELRGRYPDHVGRDLGATGVPVPE